MACTYNLRGHIFNSELELDSFLLEKGKYLEKYKDIVFSTKEQQLAQAEELEKIHKESEKNWELWKKAPKIYGEHGEVDINQPPYVGVNRFIASLKGSERLVPEFIPAEYWKRQYEQWKIGVYTPTELEVFGYTEENAPKIDDPVQWKKMQDQVEKRWKAQAGCGDLIHNINQLYFSKDGDKYVFEKNDSELRQYIINNIEEKNKEYLANPSTSEYLNTINSIIDNIKNFHQRIKQELGDNLMFFPEMCLTSNNIINPTTGKTERLIGFLDLVVLDQNGQAHIIDYKTSIKDYNDFGSVKHKAIRYQLGFYKQMLQDKGIPVNKLIISPIKLKGFALKNNKYTFEGVTSVTNYQEIQTEITEDMKDNIRDFIPDPPLKLNITSEKGIENVNNIMKSFFEDYSSNKQYTLEDTIDFLKKRKLLTPNDEGEYIFKQYDTKNKAIISKDQTDFAKQVHDYLQNQESRRVSTAKDVKSQIRDAIKKGPENVKWISARINNGESVSWFQDNLYKYCNENWKVLDNEMVESFGGILLQNIRTNQVDFIRISSRILDHNPNSRITDKNDIRKNRLGLTYKFENDVTEQSKSDSLMLEAAQGNLELIEMMAILNQLDGLNDVKIGNITVYNPFNSTKVQATNEELLYCWNALNKHKPIANNRFEEGIGNQIKFAPKFELAVNEFRDIMSKAKENQFKDNYAVYAGFQECSDLLSRQLGESVAVENQINALNKLIQKLRADDKTAQIIDRIYTDSKSLNNDTISLYNTIITTIAQLKGINFRQQLSDHSKWFETAAILRHGISGTYTDNPGNLNSQTLNLVTRVVTEAYQNTRDEMQREKYEIRRAVDKYKSAKGATALTLNLGQNQVDLYKNLIREVPTENGMTDLMFKNIRDVSGAEKEFLQFVLNKINKRRFPEKTQEQLDVMRDDYDNVDYYRVPLAIGGVDSEISAKGLSTMFKDKLRLLWNPKESFKRAREKIEGIFQSEKSTSEQRKQQAVMDIFKMTNMFDETSVSTEQRLEKIKNLGISRFERNLELLLLKHEFAYIQKKNIDQVFPLIKASAIHLAEQGANQNIKFEKDLGYIRDYITNKIKNQSIVNPEFESAVQVASGIKRAASLLTLAFAPVQAIYQPLQGLWQDISLMIRKPDGKNSFTFNHFKNAFKIVARDLTHFSDKPTLCSLLNELYAINDMDMNVYAERISKAKKGIWNLENLMMKFASRPDYYNRMSIFLSQMQGDGCLDAHTLENGELKYDWKNDKRFDVYANGRTTDPKYNEQKQLYNLIAQQFINEHTMIVDKTTGELREFKLGDDLPRAYTNKQAESMKSLADDIYGYYSHEKKSLIMATGLGSMWLQFKTYWSGKKNQYLQKGGVRMRGTWEQKTEIDKNGNVVKLYHQVDKNGHILYNKPLTTEPTPAPVMQWKGQWQEGVLLTMSDFAKNVISDPKNFIQHFKDKWENPDENLRNCYQSNMKQFIYDLLMFFVLGSILGALLGDWLQEMKDEKKDNTNLMEGVKLAGANVLVSSVKNSFLDLNFIESIGSPIGSWTPFAFEWTARQWKNISKTATGDEDIWDGILNIASANKQIRPIFDSIKPEMFRTKKEGGTWESATVKRNREKRENS